jgi:hypothetical protein
MAVTGAGWPATLLGGAVVGRRRVVVARGPDYRQHRDQEPDGGHREHHHCGVVDHLDGRVQTLAAATPTAAGDTPRLHGPPAGVAPAHGEREHEHEQYRRRRQHHQPGPHLQEVTAPQEVPHDDHERREDEQLDLRLPQGGDAEQLLEPVQLVAPTGGLGGHAALPGALFGGRVRYRKPPEQDPDDPAGATAALDGPQGRRRHRQREDGDPRDGRLLQGVPLHGGTLPIWNLKLVRVWAGDTRSVKEFLNSLIGRVAPVLRYRLTKPFGPACR